MTRLQDFCESQLARGRAYFTKSEAVEALSIAPRAFLAAADRLIKKRRLVLLKRGFYLILKPEDRSRGAPDPARWIDPLMKHLAVEYRISLLRAAAFHGSTHQAAMVFQVIAPKQLAEIVIGRQRVQFLYQAPAAFKSVNRTDWLAQLKTEAGHAAVAGVELTLLDFCRYFHRAGGMNGVAQAVCELGRKASPHILAEAAASYENSAVRRLGFLLDRFGHRRQGRSLQAFGKKAKSFTKLDPAASAIASVLTELQEKDSIWKVLVNAPVEIDV